MGANVEHKISDNFLLGTFLKMTERHSPRNQVLVKNPLITLFFGLNTNFGVPFDKVGGYLKFRYRCAFKPFC
jgi:hypothetical protein